MWSISSLLFGQWISRCNSWKAFCYSIFQAVFEFALVEQILWPCTAWSLPLGAREAGWWGCSRVGFWCWCMQSAVRHRAALGVTAACPEIHLRPHSQQWGWPKGILRDCPPLSLHQQELSLSRASPLHPHRPPFTAGWGLHRSLPFTSPKPGCQNPPEPIEWKTPCDSLLLGKNVCFLLL